MPKYQKIYSILYLQYLQITISKKSLTPSDFEQIFQINAIFYDIMNTIFDPIFFSK